MPSGTNPQVLPKPERMEALQKCPFPDLVFELFALDRCYLMFRQITDQIIVKILEAAGLLK